MKSTVSFLAIILISFSAQAQRTLIVDNTGSAPEGEHIYTDLQTALNNISDGDKILLTPSSIAYVWPTNEQSLVSQSNYSIVGAGLNNDLDNSIQKARSMISGQVFLGSSNNVTNVVFDGVVFNEGIIINGTNSVIKNSQITQYLVFARSTGINRNPFAGNIILKNNILLSLSQLTHEGNTNGLVYENNILFVHEGGRVAINSSTLNNNLMIGFNTNSKLNGIENIFNNNIINGFTETEGMTRSVFNHNLMETDLGQNDGSSGEQNIVKEFDLTTIFEDERIVANEWNRQWELNSYSDDIVGRASHGGDIGPTGSNSGTPFTRISYSLPVITDLIAPTTFKVGTNPTITIKAKGN